MYPLNIRSNLEIRFSQTTLESFNLSLFLTATLKNPNKQNIESDLIKMIAKPLLNLLSNDSGNTVPIRLHGECVLWKKKWKRDHQAQGFEVTYFSAIKKNLKNAIKSFSRHSFVF